MALSHEKMTLTEAILFFKNNKESFDAPEAVDVIMENFKITGKVPLEQHEIIATFQNESIVVDSGEFDNVEDLEMHVTKLFEKMEKLKRKNRLSYALVTKKRKRLLDLEQIDAEKTEKKVNEYILVERTIDTSIVDQLLEEKYPTPQRAGRVLKSLIKDVCDENNIDASDYRGKRNQAIILARIFDESSVRVLFPSISIGFLVPIFIAHEPTLNVKMACRKAMSLQKSLGIFQIDEDGETAKYNASFSLLHLMKQEKLYLKKRDGIDLQNFVRTIGSLSWMLPKEEDELTKLFTQILEQNDTDSFTTTAQCLLIQQVVKIAFEQDFEIFKRMIPSTKIEHAINTNEHLHSEWDDVSRVSTLAKELKKLQDEQQVAKEFGIEIDLRNMSEASRRKLEPYQDRFNIVQMTEATKAYIKPGKDDLMGGTDCHPDFLNIAEYIDAAVTVDGKPVCAFFIVFWPESPLLSTRGVLVTFFSLREYNVFDAKQEENFIAGICGMIAMSLIMNIFELEALLYDALMSAVGYYTKTSSHVGHKRGEEVTLGMGIPEKYWATKCIDTYSNCIPLYWTNAGSTAPLEYTTGQKGLCVCRNMLKCHNPIYTRGFRIIHSCIPCNS